MNLHDIHTPHVVFACYMLAHLLFLIFGKTLIQQALMHKGTASSIRLTGFMFSNLICFIEAWRCIILHQITTWDIAALLIAIGMLYGIIQPKEILEFKNGTQQPPQQVVIKKETETLESSTETQTKV